MATDYGSKIIRMHDEVARLLERAGIREPYDELRDADYGYRRMRIRQLFFGVGDARLRRRLIWLTREIDTLMPKLIQADYAETTRTLRASERKAITGSWGVAAAIAGLGVALGQLAFDLPGAIGGALVGYFLGRGYVESSKLKAAAVAEWAKARLEENRRHGESLPRKPEMFSASEAGTGEEDKGLFSEVMTQKNRATSS